MEFSDIFEFKLGRLQMGGNNMGLQTLGNQKSGRDKDWYLTILPRPVIALQHPQLTTLSTAAMEIHQKIPRHAGLDQGPDFPYSALEDA